MTVCVCVSHSLSLFRVSRGQRSYVSNRTVEIVVCVVFEVERCLLDGWDFITWDAWVSCYRRGANTHRRREGTVVTQSACWGCCLYKLFRNNQVYMYAAYSFWESFEGWFQMQILKMSSFFKGETLALRDHGGPYLLGTLKSHPQSLSKRNQLNVSTISKSQRYCIKSNVWMLYGFILIGLWNT